MWHFAAIEFVTIVPVWLTYAAEQGVFMFQCYEPWKGQRGCRIFVSLLSGFHRPVDLFGFASFVVCCAFLSALAYLAYFRSAEVDWSSFEAVIRWFPFTFAEGRVHELVETFLSSLKREASQVLGPNGLYTAPAVVWAEPSADQCSSLPNSMAFKHPPSQMYSGVTDPPLALPSVPKVDEVDFARACRCILLSFKIGASSTYLKHQQRLLGSSNWRFAPWILLLSKKKYCLVWTRCPVSFSRSKGRYSLLSIRYCRFCGLKVGGIQNTRL